MRTSSYSQRLAHDGLAVATHRHDGDGTTLLFELQRAPRRTTRRRGDKNYTVGVNCVSPSVKTVPACRVKGFATNKNSVDVLREQACKGKLHGQVRSAGTIPSEASDNKNWPQHFRMDYLWRPNKDRTMREITFGKLAEAMSEEMRRDESVFLLGEEVAEYNGAQGIKGMLTSLAQTVSSTRPSPNLDSAPSPWGRP